MLRRLVELINEIPKINKGYDFWIHIFADYEKWLDASLNTLAPFEFSDWVHLDYDRHDSVDSVLLPSMFSFCWSRIKMK